MRVSAALVAAFLTAVPASAETLVYRVDQATAVIDGHHLVITAKGAVRTGGWEHPRLIVRRAEHGPGDVEIAFTATPPADSEAVVQSLIPVKVSLKTRMPKSGVAAVRVVSQTNSVTAQIIPKYDARKTASR